MKTGTLRPNGSGAQKTSCWIYGTFDDIAHTP